MVVARQVVVALVGGGPGEPVGVVGGGGQAVRSRACLRGRVMLQEVGGRPALTLGVLALPAGRLVVLRRCRSTPGSTARLCMDW